MDLRDTLKQRAVDLGFDLVGVAPATPGRDLAFAREWLQRGFAGEMGYLSNPKRLDPSLVLPSIKSVICVGLIYETPFPYSTEVTKTGVRSQESGVRSEGFEGSRLKSAGSEPQSVEIQPSPSGRGWSVRQPTDGPGEGMGQPVSNFRFPVSRDSGGQDAGSTSLTAVSLPNGRPPRGWIARYAWGRDYHEIMREKLEKLRASIEELAPGTETRVFVDTGPVSERAFARFSGLGWMGKNTCIINEGKGSWFFLGVILTNLALEPDLPAPDRCGSCTACLDACPTGALVEPYVMDASRCISYLTIELKGSIPVEFRAAMGANIFGCDICQDVCPWNGKSGIQDSGVRRQESAFPPLVVAPRAFGAQPFPKDEGQRTKDEVRITNDERQETGNWKLETGNSTIGIDPLSADSSQQSADGRWSSIQNPKSKIQNSPSPQSLEPSTYSLFSPPLAALASMTEDDFRQAFRHSPIKRAKYRGWLRNLCVAMGNSGDARFLPKLRDLAAHAHPVVREHAEWALAQIRRPTDS